MDTEEETDLFARLAAPFPVESVHWRVGSTNKKKEGYKYPEGTEGIALAYIDSRDVMDRMDRVVGPAFWQADFTAHGAATLCRVGIKLGGEWVWKSDGAGQTNVEGDKGQFSDAFKRAAVHWGVGRYLYSLDSPWVKIDTRGRIEKEEKSKLNAVLEKHLDKENWGERADQIALRLLQAIIPENYTRDTISGFLADHNGILAQFPKKTKEELWSTIQRIQQPSKAAAE